MKKIPNDPMSRVIEKTACEVARYAEAIVKENFDCGEQHRPILDSVYWAVKHSIGDTLEMAYQLTKTRKRNDEHVDDL